MAEEVDDKKKPKIIGDYRIGKVLGTGSYGYVRLGVNVVTGEHVCTFPIPLFNIYSISLDTPKT